MAIRQIDDKIIDDPWMLDLEIEEKLLYLHLIMNPSMGMIGIYPYSMKIMSVRTSIPIENIKTILMKFKNDKKIFYENNYVIIPDYYKYTSFNLPDMKKKANKQISELPQSIIDNHPDIIEKIQKLSAATATSTSCQHNPEIPADSIRYQHTLPAYAADSKKIEKNNACSNSYQPMLPAGTTSNGCQHMPTHSRDINPNPNPNPNPNTKSIPPDPSIYSEFPTTNKYGLRELGNFVQLPDGKIVRKEEMKKLKRMDGMDGSEKIPSQDGMDGMDGSEKIPSQDGMDGMKKTNEKKGKNPEKEKGWRPNAGYYAEGIWLTDEEFNKLRTEFGDDIALNSPEITSSWAKEKGIEIIDTYKMCKKIAKKMLEEQNGKNC